MDDQEEQMKAAAGVLRAARAAAVLTGAGISAESGVPTFRGTRGLWRTYRPEELATPEAFERDPALVWEWYRRQRSLIAAVAPNEGHRALARMEQRRQPFTLVTQNYDGLHARAGSRRVLEVHGSLWRDRCCENPGHRFDVDQAGEIGPLDAPPPRCSCGAMLRPDIVWFGEMLDSAVLDQAVEAVRSADILLVVGTSSVVHPIAALPEIAREAGTCVVEVNSEATALTPFAHYSLRGPSGTVLPRLEHLAFA
jgi:NAD-dependent deacetylase